MCSVASVTVLLVLVTGSYGESSYQQDGSTIRTLHNVREQKLETILDNFMIHVDERLDQMEDTFSNTTAEIQKKNMCLYQSAIACEQKELNIECEAGNLINLIRANYGRLSIDTCNSYGDTNTNCKSSTTIKKLTNRCSGKKRCNVSASNDIFGDPCPGTVKYLEVHYTCEPPTIHEIDFESIAGEAKATSEWDTNWVPMNAFTGNKHGWHNARDSSLIEIPQLLWYEFPVPKSINRFSFKTRTDEAPIQQYGPSKYIFWGSNGIDCSDESSWDRLFEDLSGTLFDVNNTPKEEDVNNINFYKCYGFKVLESNGGAITAISNVRMYLNMNAACVSTCPSGYREVESQCLAFRNDTQLSWQDSQYECMRTGGRLANFKDHAKLTKTNYAGQNFWVGASDIHNEGEWLWISGGTVPSSIWSPGEPNNHDGGEHCMMWYGRANKGFNGSICSMLRNFICEAEME